MVAQKVEFVTEGFRLGQFAVRVALLHDQLPPHFGRRQAGIQTVIAKLRIGLALPIHDGTKVVEEVRQMRFGGFSPALREGIGAGDTTAQFVCSFADGRSVPAEFALGEALSTLAEFLDGARHEQTSVASFERIGGVYKQGLETGGEFHMVAPAGDSRLFHVDGTL